MNVELNVNALGKALQRLDESLAYDLAQPLVVDACIQRFEFCIELTWKTLKKCLAIEGIEANTPRECIQQAYSIHWLNDETKSDIAHLQRRFSFRNLLSAACSLFCIN